MHRGNHRFRILRRPMKHFRGAWFHHLLVLSMDHLSHPYKRWLHLLKHIAFVAWYLVHSKLLYIQLLWCNWYPSIVELQRWFLTGAFLEWGHFCRAKFSITFNIRLAWACSWVSIDMLGHSIARWLTFSVAWQFFISRVHQSYWFNIIWPLPKVLKSQDHVIVIQCFRIVLRMRQLKKMIVRRKIVHEKGFVPISIISVFELGSLMQDQFGNWWSIQLLFIERAIQSLETI